MFICARGVLFSENSLEVWLFLVYVLSNDRLVVSWQMRGYVFDLRIACEINTNFWCCFILEFIHCLNISKKCDREGYKLVQSNLSYSYCCHPFVLYVYVGSHEQRHDQVEE